MLRNAILHGCKKHASNIAPLFLLAGLFLIVALPAVKPKKNFIDENAVKVGDIPLQLTLSDASHPDTTVHKGHRIVHGRRSVGSESIAVYVNADEESSVIVANFVIDAIRKKDNMGCDTHIYFLKSNASHCPIPDSFVRSALIINVSSLNTRDLCFGVYGKDGMQPNQDLFNVAVSAARDLNLQVDLLCQNPHLTYSVTRSKYEHYLAALQTALIAPQHVQPWYSLRSHGISALAISTAKSDGLYDPLTAYSISALHAQVIGTLSYLDERFHHSTSVWVPLGVQEYIEYDFAQFGIILLVGSLLSVGYSVYEVEGLSLSLRVLLIWISPVLASGATEWFGVSGFLLSSIVMVMTWSVCEWDLSWLTINAVVLCLLIILQPAAGLFVGSGVAVQLAFLHAKCRRSLALIVGSVFAWAIFFYFMIVLDRRTCDTKTIGGMYFSFFVYPNALWVSSRLMRWILW